MKTKAWVFTLALMLSVALMPAAWAQQTKISLASLTYRWAYPGAQDNIRAIVAKGDTIFAGTDEKYLQVSYDAGRTWVQRGPESGLNIPWGTIDALAFTPSQDILLVAGGGTYKSTDNGENWRKVYHKGGHILLTTKGGAIFGGTAAGPGAGIRKSTDNGETWITVADSLLSTSSYFTGLVETSTGTLLASTNCCIIGGSEGIFRSTDGGEVWVRSNCGLTDSNIVGIVANPAVLPNSIYAMTYLHGAYVSYDDGLTWVKVEGITEWHGGAAFVSPNLGDFLGFSVFRRDPLYWQLSADSDWTVIQGLLGYAVLSFAQADEHRLVVGTHDGVWLLTFEASPVNHPPILSVIADTVNVRVDSLYQGEFQGSDEDGDTLRYCLLQNSSFLQIDSATGRIWGTPGKGDVGFHLVVGEVSDGKGGADTASFTIEVFDIVPPVNHPPILSVVAPDSAYADSSYRAEFQGTDGDGDTLMYCFIQAPGFLGLDSATGIVTGIPAKEDTGSYLVVGTVTDGRGGADTASFTLHVEDKSFVSIVDGEEKSAPSVFSLGQNFPNPFNPTTTIEFSIPKRTNVNLAVYNVLGQRIETLVDETKEVGIYRTEWHASQYSSGIYFCILEAANFKTSKKMLLVK